MPNQDIQRTDNRELPKRVQRPWTAELEAEVRRLWEDEHCSASVIGRMIGRSKNAIIGKVIRMKLKPHNRLEKVREANGARHRPDGRLFSRQPAFRPILLPEIAPPRVDLSRGVAWTPLPGCVPVPLIDLEHGMCKWPVTETSPFLFCGAASGDQSYCDHHHRLSVGAGTPFERAADAILEAA